MLRKATVAALAVGLLGAASAQAAVKAGVYKGKTAQNAAVSLRVISSRKAVVQYSWEGAVLTCDNGKQVQVGGDKTPVTEKFPINSKGQFGFTGGTTDGTASVGVKGRIKAPRATGILRMVARVNEQGALDPNGTVACDSDDVPWTAKKR
jgi:hypothetical protein